MSNSRRSATHPLTPGSASSQVFLDTPCTSARTSRLICSVTCLRVVGSVRSGGIRASTSDRVRVRSEAEPAETEVVLEVVGIWMEVAMAPGLLLSCCTPAWTHFRFARYTFAPGLSSVIHYQLGESGASPDGCSTASNIASVDQCWYEGRPR